MQSAKLLKNDPSGARRAEVLCLVAIVICAALVRAVPLGRYYYHVDELMYLFIAKASSLAEVWQRGLQEMLPPFGHFARYFYLKFADSPDFHRMTSLVHGLFAVCTAYYLARRSMGAAAAVAFALVGAFSYAAVSYTVIVRNYALFYLLLLLSLHFFLEFVRSPSPGRLAAYMLCATLAAGTHFGGFIVMAGMGLAGTLHLISSRAGYKVLGLWFISHLLPAALALLIYAAYFSPGSYGRGWLDFYAHKAPLLTFRADPRISTLFRFFHVFWGLMIRDYYAAVALMMVFAAGLWVMWRSYRILFTTIAAVFLVQLVLSAMSLIPFAGVRYCFYLLPFISLPGAAAVQALASAAARPLSTKARLRSRTTAWYLTAAASFLFAAAAIQVNLYYRSNPEMLLEKSGYAAVLGALDREAAPEDVILTNKGTWLYLFYDSTSGKEMYADQPFGSYSFRGRRIFFQGLPYFWEYALPENLREFLKEAGQQPELIRAPRIWFLVVGASDFSILTLSACPSLQPEINVVLSGRGVSMFTVTRGLIERVVRSDPDVEACFAASNIARIGNLFGAGA